SMEFIEGETLSARLRRTGAMPPEEAREIARQICAGLAQAHQQGVIHGDLKCGNILLAKTTDGATRAVITDFGLARVNFGGRAGWDSGGGPAEYMAPELFLGERASIASDIYALGVMFQVMLTGVPPKRLGEPPTAQTQTWASGSAASTKTVGAKIAPADWQREIADLPAPWKKIVTRCLAAKPEQRFHSAEQVSRAFEPRRLALKIGTAVVVTAGLAFGFWKSQAPAPETPVRLAILPFSTEGDPLPAAAGVANDVADRLSGARRNFVVITPRENQNQRVDSSEKARRIVGATHALQTRLRTTGTEVTAQASLTDVVSGQRIGEPLRGVYAVADPSALAKALIATVTQGFRLKSRVPQETVAPGAYADYAQAIELLRRDGNNAAQAIPLLERAVERDPRSALPYAGLAEAQLQRFGRGEGPEWLDRAAANVAKAKSLNPDSHPVLLASGLAEQERGQYERAIRDYTRATELNPTSSDGWRRLANVYNATNRPEEAIATYRKAIAAQPDYYLQYIAFGNFYLNRNEYSQAEQQYRRVTSSAPELADGHMNLGLALMRQGRFADAEASMTRALSLRRTPLLLSNLGSLYYAQERFTEAERFYKECVESQPSALRYRNLGDAYRHLRKRKEAQQAYLAGQKLAEQEVARNPRQASARVRLAILCAFLGESRRAESELLQALSLDPENAGVMRESSIAYEFLRQREKTLAVLQNAPKYLLEDLNRQPDTGQLRKDSRFLDLLQRKATQ
ncbi:MAG TPA: tetratricopeptide repeat protein, partial [Bryobacteraceae bacterium]|nr:tetratricopeptide repeat protein [Bryobacteraceae bacterium]